MTTLDIFYNFLPIILMEFILESYYKTKDMKATSLMKLMGMGIVKGDEVTITVEGDDEDAACAAIEAFMKANF